MEGDIVGYYGNLDEFCSVEAPDGSNQKAILVAIGGGKPQATDVYIQDQTTDPVIAKFNMVHNATTLATATAIDDVTLTVTSPTGFASGNYLIMYSNVTDKFMTAYILDVTGSVVTIDTPIDSVFPVGSIVAAAVTNMNVDGSSTHKYFGLRGTNQPDPINVYFDVTRIIFSCTSTNAVDLSKFADIAGGITNGLVLRKKNGTYKNIFNLKTNQEIAGIMFDFTPYAATNPVQGQNGFVSRLTFAGQEKIGVVIRLAPGEDLEFIVQDNLSTITKFEVMAEGHIVDL